MPKHVQELEEQLKNHVVHECEVYARVVGYYRPVKQWNAGKQSEWRDRKLFDAAVPRQEPDNRRPHDNTRIHCTAK